MKVRTPNQESGSRRQESNYGFKSCEAWEGYGHCNALGVTGTEDVSGGLYLVDFTPADLVVLQLVPEHSRS